MDDGDVDDIVDDIDSLVMTIIIILTMTLMMVVLIILAFLPGALSWGSWSAPLVWPPEEDIMEINPINHK